jgi:lipoprotein-releasing system ATP-binding protein
MKNQNNDFIKVENLRKHYKTPDGNLEILKGVDLTLDKGGLYFVVGKSGSGKSTLLHILGGLDKPTAGNVHYEGVDIYRMREREIAGLRNRSIGFVFQFFHLLPELTLFENIGLPSLISRKKAKERVRWLIERLGLQGREKHMPSQLSGGEQQRAAIARALVNEPKIVFCDEPTGNLDEKTADEMRQLIEDIHQKMGTTFLIVTHDEELTKGATKIYHLHEGHLSETGQEN